MVNSVLLVDQYMTHFLKMVQVLSHAVVHPQVCVDPIHNEVPKYSYMVICKGSATPYNLVQPP